MANPIKAIYTKAGTKVWRVDGRKFNAVPVRPQFATKEQAEAALAEMIAKRGAGLASRRDKTFAMLADEFIRDNSIGDEALSGRTLRGYADALRVHLIPAFGSKRVIDLQNPAAFNAFFAAKTAEGKKPSTIRLYKSLLSTVLQTAVGTLIATNPIASIKKVKTSRNARKARREAVPKDRCYTEKQIADLLEWCGARDQELGDYIFTLLKTGARPGEARALRWGDVAGDQLRIERSADDKDVITDTKTGEKRTIDIPASLQDALKLRKLKRERAGHDVSDEHYVFGNGVPITHRAIAHRLGLAQRECGIEGHSLYDFRHTYASVLLQRCRDVIYVARQMGHAKASTTLDFYAHFLVATSQRFADQLDDAPVASAEADEVHTE